MARKPKPGERFPPANDGGVAATIPAPAMSPPAAFFPQRARFPGVRPAGSASGSQLPRRLHMHALGAIGAAPIAAAPLPAPPAEPAPQFLDSPAPAAPADAPQFVIPPQPPPLPAPPIRIIGAAQAGAAASNAYQERLADREANRWGSRKSIVQPETLLVHAWAFALSQYPASALTVWLQCTSPAEQPYSFYITGDQLAGDPYPDRKIYETVRTKRRRPHLAESFSGRIRGITAEGQVLDIGGGEIHMPPEAPQQAAQWGPQQPPPQLPTGYGYGAPPWGGPPAMMGQPPPWPGGVSGPWGPWGPPPWWAQYGGAPQLAAPQAAPPAAIAHDAVAVELWKGMQEIQARSVQSSSDAQLEVAKLQNAMMMKLIERAGQPAASAAPSGGIKESFELMRSALELVNGLKGGDSKGGLEILETKSGDKIFSTGGKIHEHLTAGFAIKDAATDLFKGLGARMKPPGQAAGGGAVAGGGVGGSSLPPKTAVAAVAPKAGGAGTNGAA